MNDKIAYTCVGYKYAPESFRCFMVVINARGYNHSYYELENFTEEENHRVAMICISKGKKEAEAEIKKIVRNKKEDYKNITYGYKVINENMVAYLKYHRICDSANIQEKLKLYKEIKEYFKNKNFIITECVLNSWKLDGNYNPLNPQTKEVKQILNPKPIKIRFIKRKEVNS